MRVTQVTYLVTFNDGEYEKVKANSPIEAINIVNATKSEMTDIKCYLISPVMTEPREV